MNCQRNIYVLGAVLYVLFFLTILSCSQKEKGKSKLSTELNVFNWSYYIGETTIQDFEDQYGIEVTYDNYSSNEELLAKLQAGVKGYDVVFPSDYMVEIMRMQDLLAPLDLANIPNFENILPRFRNLSFDPENQFSVPYQWGTTGLGIDTSRVKGNFESWDILWDARYKGRITMLDDMRFGLVPALKRLGYSINTTKTKELERAKELMIEQKPLVKAYTSDTYIDLLKSGDVWIAYGYSGDIYQVAKENPNVVYFIPVEGTNIWVDNMCILKDASHKYTAEIFINYILLPKVSADISNYTWYSSPNGAAKEFIIKEIVQDDGIYPPKELLDKCEFLKDVGESTRLFDRIWNEIKSN